ncbi:MAG: hypothetical protein JXA03_09325 [Bacteroidales bacterium]|nr:hypothetical protein [Bacteroidales bacterium]
MPKISEQSFARFISWLFHPIFLPFYVLSWLLFSGLYFSFTLPFNLKMIITGMVLITTVIFPSVFIMMLYRRKVIESLYMYKREDRVFPFIITSVFFFLTFHLFRQLHILAGFQGFMLGATLLIIVCIFVNFMTKVSIHMAGMGGCFGFLLGISYQMNDIYLSALVISLIISGFTGYSRLKLQVHTPAQVYSGFLIGTVVMFFVFLVRS